MTARMKVDGAFLPSTRNSRAIIAAKVLTRVGCGTGASVISAAIASLTGASAASPPAPMFTGWRAPPRALTVVAIICLLPVLTAGQGQEHGFQAGLGLSGVQDVQAVPRADADQLTEDALGLGAEDTELLAVGFHLGDVGEPGQARTLGQVLGYRFLEADGDDRGGA